MIFAGVSDCYSRCDEVLEKFLSIEVNSMEVYRVTDRYGEELEREEDFSDGILSPVQKEEIVYVMVDGSMIFTRTEGWKEVKLGRVFKSSDSIDPGGKQERIQHSQYLAYLGNDGL